MEMDTSTRPEPSLRLFHVNLTSWSWWVWTATACLLLAGIMGVRVAFPLAMATTVAQLAFLLARDRKLRTFPVQLRVAYLLLLLVCHLPGMNWLYWWPMLGTFALVVFGYCLLARVLSLLPMNSAEPYSIERLKRTFISRPDPRRASRSSSSMGCPRNLCSIAAQVPPPTAIPSQGKKPTPIGTPSMG